MTLRNFFFCSREKARMYHSDTLIGEPSRRLTPKSIVSSPERSPVATRGFYTSPALKVALNPLYTVGVAVTLELNPNDVPLTLYRTRFCTSTQAVGQNWTVLARY